MNGEPAELNEEVVEKKRFELERVDKTFIIVLAVISLLIIALNVLQRLGLSLISGAAMLYLPLLAAVILLGWGGYALIRRIKNRTVKLVVSSVAVLLLFLGMVLVFSYLSLVASFSVPQRYATLKSPSGKRTVVVMRAIDPDEERINQRHDARLAAAPDSSPDIEAMDWGLLYRAYPKALIMFYRSNADVEGEVRLGYGDGAIAGAPGENGEAGETIQLPRGELMVEWQEDESSVRLFVKDPGAAEGGECILKF